MADNTQKESSESLKTIFNMDIANLARIDWLINLLDTAMLSWDLEGASFIIKRIYVAISPKLKDAEEKEVNKLLGEICKYRNENNRALWFSKLEELDIKLRKLMKTYGIIFQDTSDPRTAVLRR